MLYPIAWLTMTTLALGATGCARKFYFHPMQYPGDGPVLPEYCIRLAFKTTQGRQEAFYLPPAGAPGRPPQQLWYLFGGNASVALGWLPLVNSLRSKRAGFLLFEYPGCGQNEGHPSRSSIHESAQGALAALEKHLGVDDGFFDGKLNLLGHSLGCAAALDFAAHQRVERLVLLAPFTSMCDMARHYVGWPFCLMTPDRFDNEVRLHELYARGHRPAVLILHGTHDWVIPVWMSRKLAGLFPDWIEYHEIPGGTHNSILGQGATAIAQAMPRGRTVARKKLIRIKITRQEHLPCSRAYT